MNNNLTEDYCSFEVSKLLKEKGFEAPCNKVYSNEGELLQSGRLPSYHNFNEKISTLNYNNSSCSCPTHALAIKWIRENFRDNFYINFFPYTYRNKLFIEVRIFGHHFRTSGFKTESEAIEAALLYTLKHLI